MPPASRAGEPNAAGHEPGGVLRVITCNLNGIRAAARKGFFRWMEAQDPDVVCLQETKAQEHQLPPEALDLTRYTLGLRRRAEERLQRGRDLRQAPAAAASCAAWGWRTWTPRAASCGWISRAGSRSRRCTCPRARPGRPARRSSTSFLDRFIALAGADEERGPPVHRLRRLQHRAPRHRRLQPQPLRRRDRLPAPGAGLDGRRDRARRLGRRLSRGRPGAQAVHLVVGLEGRVGEQPGLADRLPARHAGPRAARARGRRSTATSGSPTTRR